MKTTRRTITGPDLFVDDHHGQYMGKLAWEYLADRYKKQAIKNGFTDEDIKDISDPENEFHCEACDKLTSIEFKTETGQKFTIQYAEGGMYIIPACFRGKKANEFWSNMA